MLELCRFLIALLLPSVFGRDKTRQVKLSAKRAPFATLLLLSAAPVMAETGPIPFSDAAFARSQAEERIFVLETFAWWCLTCRIQAPILAELRRQDQFRDVVVLRIGEETPNPAWKRFKLHGYGTLIVFKGRNEVARGSPTTEAEMADLLRAPN